MDLLLNTYRTISDDVLDCFKGDEETIFSQFLNKFPLLLNDWAAIRDYCTVRVKAGDKTTQYPLEIARADQLIKLKPIICKPNTEVEITVENSKAERLLHVRKTVSAPTDSWSGFFKKATMVAAASVAAATVVLGFTH